MVDLCEKFTDRGFTPYTIVFLFFWGIVTLLIKWRKLKFQEQALDLAVVPQEPDFSLNPESAKAVLARTETLVDSASNFILLNRIEVALSNLSNIGQISDVSSILGNQSKIDEQQVASSYNLIRGFIWAAPVLGFIGTVLGLGDAIGGFGKTIAGTQEVEAIKESLGGVTAGLSTAFDTTLVGLIATLSLHFLTNFLKFRESLFLDQCNDYCQVRSCQIEAYHKTRKHTQCLISSEEKMMTASSLFRMLSPRFGNPDTHRSSVVVYHQCGEC